MGESPTGRPLARNGKWLDPLLPGELPPPRSLHSMLGLSILILAVGIGSGEFLVFPSLTTQYGFVLLWAAWVGCLLQFFVNMEIARWTMLTGETVTTGFARLGRIWPWFFLVGNIVPWMWPGWTTSAGTCVAYLIGGNYVWYSIFGLVIGGVIFSFGRVVYQTAMFVQTSLIILAMVFMAIVAIGIVDGTTIGPLLSGLISVGSIPEDIDVPLLSTAIAFAGAGGTLNIAHSAYVREKKYAMGATAGRLISPLTGQEEPIATTGYTAPVDDKTLRIWRTWWRRANIEHFLTFFCLGVLSIVLLSLTAYNCIGSGNNLVGMVFVDHIASVIGERLGGWARGLYLLMGAAVLLTTGFGILDATSRISADILKVNVARIRRSGWWTEGKLYLAFLWLEIALGVLVLLIGLDQPFILLTVSGTLNLLVMAVYTVLLIFMNSGMLVDKAVGLRGPRLIAMLIAAFFYCTFSVIAIANFLM